MKHFLSLILLLFCIISEAAIAPNDFSYTIIDGSTCRIDGPKSGIELSGDLVIPSEVQIEGEIFKVVEIGEQAFLSCSSLTSVTIPSSVTSIGSAAFCFCSGLSLVTIPSSVISIGDNAFSYCDCLSSIDIPNGVTYIGHAAFSYCYNMLRVTIPSSVTFIGGWAFARCN